MPTIALLLALVCAIPQSNLDPIPYIRVVVDGKSHLLAFTFDDHPTHKTDAMLDILARHKIRATFFVVTYPIWLYYLNPKYGPTKRRFESLLRIKKDGHLIGNHSHTHDLLCKRSFSQVLNKEVQLPQTILTRALGKAPTLWRPPHGITCRKLVQATQQFRLRWIWWHVSDYGYTVQAMWRWLLWRVRHGKTSTIVLFHNKPKKLTEFLKLLALP